MTFPFPVFVPGGENDPYYSSVVALLHLDGTNGSTTFTDNSPSPKSYAVPGGTAYISTSQSVFGGSSLYVNGGWGIEAPSHPDFSFGTGDFTVEFRVRFTGSLPSEGDLVGGTVGGSAIISYNGGTSRSDALGGGALLTNPWSPALDTWYAIAYTRSSGTIRHFIDGVKMPNELVGGEGWKNFVQAAMNVGGFQHGKWPWEGYIDEVRITKGVCRYTANYTVRTLPFPNS